MLTVVSTTLLDWYHVVFSIRWMIKVINKSTLRCSQKLNSEISEISLFKHSPPQSCSFVDRLQVSACVLLTFARRCVTLYNMRWMGACCSLCLTVPSRLVPHAAISRRISPTWRMRMKSYVSSSCSSSAAQSRWPLSTSSTPSSALALSVRRSQCAFR